MLKRDSLMAQMQQLSHILAKVKRLIVDEQEVEAQQNLADTLKTYFLIDGVDLIHWQPDAFIAWLRQRAFIAEEISQLAYFVDEYAGIQDDFRDQLPVYQKLLIIYDILEKDYGFLSLDHLNRKQILQAQLT